MKGGDDLKKGNLFQSIAKLLPIIAAGIVAICQAAADQKAAEQIEELENRVEQLEGRES